MKYSVGKYQITVCLVYIECGRKRKPKQDGFTLLSMLNHSSTQQTYVQVEKCRAEEIEKFSRRPDRHLSIWKHQQLYLMIHKASKHLKGKRWKPILGKMNRGLCMCTPVLSLRSLPAACPLSLCLHGANVETLGAEAAGPGLVLDMAVMNSVISGFLLDSMIPCFLLARIVLLLFWVVHVHHFLKNHSVARTAPLST